MKIGRKFAAAALSGGVAVAVSLGLAGVAAATSGGGYQPSNQDCQPTAEAWNGNYGSSDPTIQPGQEPGCHDMSLLVENGGTTQGNANPNNTRIAEVGMNQQPIDPNTQTVGFVLNVGLPGYKASPHAGCVAVNTAGTGGGPGGQGCGNGNKQGAGGVVNFDYYEFYCPIAALLQNPCEDQSYGKTTVTPNTGDTIAIDPTNGLVVAFNMDDNNDAGEHDGINGKQNTSGAVNGPSDGGGVLLSITPQEAAQIGSLTNPEGLANLSAGMCADGICGEATTQQQTVYHGCNANTGEQASQDKCTSTAPKNKNVYDYSNNPSVNSESPNCNSGDYNSQQACYTNADGSSNPGGMDAYRQGTAQNVNAEPGVQTYADPDPQRSPAAPWPTPGIYAGTCGVSVNPGFLSQATDPLSPLTSNLPGYNAQDHQVLAVNTGC
ncbi:MAG TPA: hypothetical protein VFA11_18920 [Acidimicrobiales bacterium]|nr:hypothetical protein [Acidimicrobiales bacterium]